MKIEILRTGSMDPDFQYLVRLLDVDLAVRDGDEHAFYAQFNKIGPIKHALVAFREKEPVGCGAFKFFDEKTVEVKRMFVLPDFRGQGFATEILKGLEVWAAEIGFERALLETGKKQPEAIALYLKNGYRSVPNFGQYVEMDNSVCFEKEIQ